MPTWCAPVVVTPDCGPSTAYTDTMPGHRIVELPVYRKFGPSLPRYGRDMLPE